MSLSLTLFCKDSVYEIAQHILQVAQVDNAPQPVVHWHFWLNRQRLLTIEHHCLYRCVMLSDCRIFMWHVGRSFAHELPCMYLRIMNQNTPCLKKSRAKLFLSELRQISTNFDNFWQKDGKEAKIMRGALIFHLN